MLAKILFMAGFYVGVSLIGHTVTGMMESEPVEQEIQYEVETAVYVEPTYEIEWTEKPDEEPSVSDEYLRELEYNSRTNYCPMGES